MTKRREKKKVLMLKKKKKRKKGAKLILVSVSSSNGDRFDTPAVRISADDGRQWLRVFDSNPYRGLAGKAAAVVDWL